MTETAPERIWAKPGYDSWNVDGDWYEDSTGGGTEYIRADLLDEAVKALEVFAKQADGRRRKDINGAVCFGQEHLIAARATLAKLRSKT